MGDQQSFLDQWISGIGNDVEEGLDNLLAGGTEIESCIDMDAERLFCRDGSLSGKCRDCTQLANLWLEAAAAKNIAVTMGND